MGRPAARASAAALRVAARPGAARTYLPALPSAPAVHATTPAELRKAMEEAEAQQKADAEAAGAAPEAKEEKE